MFSTRLWILPISLIVNLLLSTALILTSLVLNVYGGISTSYKCILSFNSSGNCGSSDEAPVITLNNPEEVR